jgi:16S rRNA (cytidine1402-2'-O)-methyltransferase
MAAVLGAREAAIAKELTKLHEGVRRGTLDRIAREIQDSEALKGEFVVVIAPPQDDEADISDANIIEQLEKALDVESFRDAVRSVAEMLQVKRSRVYQLGLVMPRKRD